jgi:type I restriction enzyme R subunit
MLADWFHEPEESAMGKVEKFETVKKKFIDEPGQMRC